MLHVSTFLPERLAARVTVPRIHALSPAVGASFPTWPLLHGLEVALVLVQRASAPEFAVTEMVTTEGS